jgi:prepilin signal peptidase PulO-like enzyme (type II secretory pathway)
MQYRCPCCGQGLSMKILTNWRQQCRHCQEVITFAPQFIIAITVLAVAYMFMPHVHILQELLTVSVLLLIFAFGARFFLVRSDD